MLENPFSSVAKLRMLPILSGFVVLGLCGVPVLAADFPDPYGPPRDFPVERRPPPPVEEFGPERGGARLIAPCRVVVRRRITPDGEEIVKRVTICEERSDRFQMEREPTGGYGEARPLRRPPLPPRDIPFADETRSGRGVDHLDERPAEELGGDERLSEEPPLEGRGRDPRY
ncbi:hypothetical protein [Methylobacterium sp. E-045]|uniref:hypothetical protein n=1 Tax=Methylobacterium sp. E-045 TaxID=2836575 RepID=UPI001FBA5DDA|nr:hypothetical protein [Methylobacterium sp. E-045]MCJ2131976.1 hypothetical protein [Methylobacterium sp. E-045]